METLYITHDICHKHEMRPWHPECPQRLDAIQDRLVAAGIYDFIAQAEAPKATDADILRAHDSQYWDYLKTHSPHEGYFAVDGEETVMNPYTIEAIYRAAGAGILAVDEVMANHVKNAFCSVRPPGHHAERSKAQGFCFVNNLVVAALYAVEKYHLQRIALVDFDVHHGNGTEDICKNDPRFLMCSFYQHTLFPTRDFNLHYDNMVNIALPAYTRADRVRELVTQDWIPALERFKPEMIMISAGFDAHREDDMGQMDLVEKDFEWITYQLMEIAHRYSQDRIISFLEGGYVMSCLGRAATAHIKALAGI